MQTIVAIVGAIAPRRLEIQAPLHFGERIVLRITGDTATLAAASASHSWLVIADDDGVPLAAAGPFTLVEPAQAADYWQAELDLATEPMQQAFAGQLPRARILAWAGLLDTDSGSLVATADAVLENNPFPLSLSPLPTLPEVLVRRGDFSALEVARPASLTSLAEQLAAILAALQGA